MENVAKIAPNIAQLFAAIGVAIGSVSGGTVIASGVLLIGGVFIVAKAGEKISEVVKTASSRKKYEICCCNQIGPSGLFKVHFIMKASRKEAEEAARHYKNANGVEFHPHNQKDPLPHFHPTRNGEKIPGVHFQFPYV